MRLFYKYVHCALYIHINFEKQHDLYYKINNVIYFLKFIMLNNNVSCIPFFLLEGNFNFQSVK
jgi:hypothetical protein